MHIPDGFLSPPVWLACDLLAAPATGWIARRVARLRQSPQLAHPTPLLGVMGAFVFAAQMINFPVAAGVSGHLLGGTLLALLLGPASAALVMTAILILQALLFQDGGVLALGANVCNMALIGVAVGYFPAWLWGRRAVTAFGGAALSVLGSGAFALVQLNLSGISITGAPLITALSLFCVTGLVEGAITVAVLRSIQRLSPRALPASVPAPARVRIAFAAAALLLATVGVWIASGAPDSLEHLAEQVGLTEQLVWVSAPLAGYQWTGLGPDWLQKSAAGLVGLVSVYAVCTLGGKRR